MASKASTAGKSRSRSSSRSASKSAQRTNVSDTRAGSQPPRRSIADHSEHPESAGDSTVRHADNPVGAASAGKKGFPQGEYDVDQPAKAAGKKQSIKDSLLEQHQAAGIYDVDDLQKRLKAKEANRLSAEERSLAAETLPIGAVIEHEGPHRWRVRAPTGGGNRFGHGQTAQEAIEGYVLGSSVTTGAQAGAAAFHALPKRQQQEITERDRKAAASQGLNPDQLPEAIARREFAANQKAAQNAKTPAFNATTDGPEVASAEMEAGRRRGNPASEEGNGTARQAAASRQRSSARRRTGGKARR